MRILIPLVLALIVGACGTLSERVTETTGMTLAERCAYYKGIAGTLDMRAAEGHLSETEQTALAFAKGFLAGCPKLES